MQRLSKSRFLGWVVAVPALICAVEPSSRSKEKISITSSSSPTTQAMAELYEASSLRADDKLSIVESEGRYAREFLTYVAAQDIKPQQTRVILTDKAKATAWQKEITARKEAEPKVSFSSLDALELKGNSLIILFVADLAEEEVQRLTQTVAALPDGVRLLSRTELESDAVVRFEGCMDVAFSPTQGVTFYQYLVKRPSAAELLGVELHDLNGFRCISQEEAEEVTNQGGNPTYGEILLSTSEKLFTELVPITEKDVFYDLGCGVGRLVLWVYLGTPAKAAYGIELCPSRYELALEGEKLVQQKIMPQYRARMEELFGTAARSKKVGFSKENMTTADFSDATVIFMCATCFSENLMKTMADKFAELKDGLRIVTLKKFPPHPALRFKHEYKLPMTWSIERGGSPVYVYEKRSPQLSDLIDELYEGVSGFAIESDEAETIRKGGGAPTYGEITPESARIVFTKLLQLDEESVFYDLGCGVGKLVVQAYLETPAQRAVGIEMSPTRYAHAVQAQRKVEEALREEPYASLWKERWGKRADTKSIAFRNENILEADFSDATAVFACATCFSPELMSSITTFCAKLPAGARVVTLKKLDECPRLKLIKTERLAMTWSSSVEVYLYVVEGAQPAHKAPAGKADGEAKRSESTAVKDERKRKSKVKAAA